MARSCDVLVLQGQIPLDWGIFLVNVVLIVLTTASAIGVHDAIAGLGKRIIEIWCPLL
jgi:hypothetical protein